MIRKIVCAIMLLVGCMAHAAVTYVGTCEGKLSATGESKTGSGTISVAVIVPAVEYRSLDGSLITGMRIGLITTSGISNVKAWIRHDLNGENIAEAEVKNPRSGWNEVAFSAPVTLKASETLVLGYDFDQESSVKCISVAGTAHDNGYWVAKNGSWQNRRSSVSGSLSVEAKVEGDEVPDINLAIESYSYDKITPLGNDYHATVVVRNMAEKRISGYSYTIDVDGKNSEGYAVNRILKADERDTIRVTVNTSLYDEGTMIPVHLTVSADGDVTASDDAVILPMTTYTKTLRHKVLMEEFSTEQCPNCPRAHNTIRNCLDAGLGDDMVLVTHHVGYRADWLTVQEDKAYEWFYGDDGTFAPAGMFDRTNLPEYHVVNSGSESTDVPVFSIGLVDTFRPALEYAISQPSFVSVAPVVDYDPQSRTMTVTVSAERLETLKAVTSDPRLTVYLIEDSILAHDQAGVSSTTYRHRHVYRKCLTDIWGDALAFDTDNSAKAEYSYVLPDDWDDNYVEVVAFVNNYNPSDRNDCCVFNAEHVAIKGEWSGIRQVHTNGSIAQGTCYNMLGQRVTQTSRGIKIINGRKIVGG